MLINQWKWARFIVHRVIKVLIDLPKTNHLISVNLYNVVVEVG